jgi:hypothetical protein
MLAIPLRHRWLKFLFPAKKRHIAEYPPHVDWIKARIHARISLLFFKVGRPKLLQKELLNFD